MRIRLASARAVEEASVAAPPSFVASGRRPSVDICLDPPPPRRGEAILEVSPSAHGSAPIPLRALQDSSRTMKMLFTRDHFRPSIARVSSCVPELDTADDCFDL